MRGYHTSDRVPDTSNMVRQYYCLPSGWVREKLLPHFTKAFKSCILEHKNNNIAIIQSERVVFLTSIHKVGVTASFLFWHRSYIAQLWIHFIGIYFGRCAPYHTNFHDDVIKWKHFPRYWNFVRGITGGFPSQMPLSRGFYVFFYTRLNKRLSKQSRRQWFETPLCSLWCHSNVIVRIFWHWYTTIKLILLQNLTIYSK